MTLFEALRTTLSSHPNLQELDSRSASLDDGKFGFKVELDSTDELGVHTFIIMVWLHNANMTNANFASHEAVGAVVELLCNRNTIWNVTSQLVEPSNPTERFSSLPSAFADGGVKEEYVTYEISLLGTDP